MNEANTCTSYFNIVSGSEHVAYREASCDHAREVLKSIKRADGIEGLKVCKLKECNEFGRLGVLTVQMLLERMSEKTQK
jgi:hypothetical protein